MPIKSSMIFPLFIAVAYIVNLRSHTNHACSFFKISAVRLERQDAHHYHEKLKSGDSVFQVVFCGHEMTKFWDVVGHLRNTWWCSVRIFHHTIIKRFWHSNNHMSEIWIEKFAIRNVDSIRWLEMISSHYVINIRSTPRFTDSNSRQITWKHPSICSLLLILTDIWWENRVRNFPFPVLPFLSKISFAHVLPDL